MKKSHFFVGLAILLSFLTFSIGFETAYSDSGWDSSYDSGGYSGGYDYDGGSYSYDSGGSYSYDYGGSSHSHSGGSSYSSGEALVMALIIAVVLFSMIYFMVKIETYKQAQRKTAPSKTEHPEYYLEDFQDLREYLPNMTITELKDELYGKFLDIQNAWMEFDYDKLRELCTDELYNSYKTQLKALKAKNGKNIMSDFFLQECTITDVKEQNGQIIVETYMRILFYDYVIDTTTNEVTRGRDTAKIKNNYLMTFVKNKDDVDTSKCPNCGAPLDKKHSATCSYCKTDVVFPSNEFILSKKTNINNK